MERSDAPISPMLKTSMWVDIFQKLDQWDVVYKFNSLNAKSNSTSQYWSYRIRTLVFARRRTPNGKYALDDSPLSPLSL